MPPRRMSLKSGNNNPLGGGGTSAAPKAAASSNTAGAKPCSASDHEALIKDLKAADDNEARIELVKTASNGKLFKCAQLLEMLETTPSVKTQMTFVTLLAPRTSDPGGASVIVETFRFSDEKNAVSEMMKNRENILKAGKMPGGGGGAAAMMGGKGGRGRGAGAGGRGGGGRGGRGAAAATPARAPPAYAVPAYAQKADSKEDAAKKEAEKEQSLIEKELENRRKAKEADEAAAKAEAVAEKLKLEKKLAEEKAANQKAAAAKKAADEKAAADKAAAEKLAIKAAQDRKAAKANQNRLALSGGGSNPLNKVGGGNNPLKAMQAKTANPAAAASTKPMLTVKSVPKPAPMPFRSGSMAGNNSYGGGLKSGSSNPFAGASALVNKNTGKSSNLNFKAGKMDAWAEETAKQKENRETSFQLIARYKFLKKVPVFKDLADHVVAQICGTLEVEDFAPDTDVVTQGDAGDKFFIIETGHVDVIRTEVDPPKTIKLATLDPGNYFGEMSLLNNAPRYATCKAVGDVRCLSLSMKDFELSVPKGLLDETASKRKEETDAKVTAVETAKEEKKDEPAAPQLSEADEQKKKEEEAKKNAPPPQVEYEVLAAMNETKEFKNYDPSKLETYLLDGEFEMRFAMDRASFYALPKWKQSNMKRMLKLY